jgi:hypothetical protein
MTAKFKEEGSETGLITCKISSSILEPHFSLPPVSTVLTHAKLEGIRMKIENVACLLRFLSIIFYRVI